MNTLIQISDCHIDDTSWILGVDTRKNLTKIVNKISTKAHDALLISGDLAHNGSLKSYQLLKKILMPLTISPYIIHGNHDNIDNINKVFAQNLTTGFYLGIWKIITINSVQKFKTSGYLSKQELLKLDSSLQDKITKYSIIVLHHPIVPMLSDWDDSLSLENPDELFTIVNKYKNVKAILWGHAHQAADFSNDKLKLISCPSTALQFNAETRIGFNKYKLFDDGNIEYATHWV